MITGAELERRQIRPAADALRMVPGLAVNRTGGVGAVTQVRIRGAEGNQVKVILDGVEVNSLDAGDFDFSTLLAADIERIEVLRGPQSGIYGASALSGVINIVTKRGSHAPSVSAEVEGGSLATTGVRANASASAESGYFSATATSRETDGFNFARGPGEADGSEQKAFFARGGISPTEYFRIDAMARYHVNNTDVDVFNSVFDPVSNTTFDDGILDDASGSPTSASKASGASRPNSTCSRSAGLINCSPTGSRTISSAAITAPRPSPISARGSASAI